MYDEAMQVERLSSRSIQMPSESLKGQIGGTPPLLSAIKITDQDNADTGLLGTNKI